MWIMINVHKCVGRSVSTRSTKYEDVNLIIDGSEKAKRDLNAGF